MSVLTVYTLSGHVAAAYPDFTPGQPLRVLPDRVSDLWPAEAGSVVDDGWTFVGPTRHPYEAVIRDDRFGTTVHMDRNRLQVRPCRTPK
ncbi:MAG: hypothetical protein U0Q47_12280 [Mycobacterium sp.]